MGMREGFEIGMAAGNRFSGIDRALQSFIASSMEQRKEERMKEWEREKIALASQEEEKLLRIRHQQNLEELKQRASLDKSDELARRMLSRLDEADDLESVKAEAEDELGKIKMELKRSPAIGKQAWMLRDVAGGFKPITSHVNVRQELGKLGRSALSSAQETMSVPGPAGLMSIGKKAIGQIGTMLGERSVKQRDIITPVARQRAAMYLEKGIPDAEGRAKIMNQAFKLREIEKKQKKALDAAGIYASLAGGGNKTSFTKEKDDRERTVFLQNLSKGLFPQKGIGGAPDQIIDMTVADITPEQVYSVAAQYGFSADEINEFMGGMVEVKDPDGNRQTVWGSLVNELLNNGWELME